MTDYKGLKYKTRGNANPKGAEEWYRSGRIKLSPSDTLGKTGKEDM